MSKADEYQKLAAECLLLAKTTGDMANRLSLLQMAGTWLKLAEQDDQGRLIAQREGPEQHGD